MAGLLYRLARQLKSIRDLEANLSSAIAHASSLEQQRNELVQDRDQLQVHLERLSQELVGARAEISQRTQSEMAQHARIAEISRERDGLLDLLKRVEMNRDDLRTELNQVYSTSHEAQFSRDVLEEERNTLRRHLQRLESELAAAELALAKRVTFFEPGHFYSPIVEPKDDLVANAALKASKSDWTQWSHPLLDNSLLYPMLQRVLRRSVECPLPEVPTAGFRFASKNPAFGSGDAITLFAMMADLRPRRWIEVGCGHSTCAALDSARALGIEPAFTFIEPFPETVLALAPEVEPNLLRVRLQDVPVQHFQQLESGDVLFIDSSHVLKTASDVNDYLFRILPALRPGVVVHVHDVFYPFEYPRQWILDDNRSWNEAYALHAFLAYNPTFQVIFFNDYCFHRWSDEVREASPRCLQEPGGSIWLRKTA